MPSGMDVFEARLNRIERGQQIVGEGVERTARRQRRRVRRRGGFGKLMILGLIVAGSVTGAVAAGHGPEGMDQQLFALTAQVQQEVSGILRLVAERSAGLVSSG